MTQFAYYNEFDPKAAAWIITNSSLVLLVNSAYDHEAHDKLGIIPKPSQATCCFLRCAKHHSVLALAYGLSQELFPLHRTHNSLEHLGYFYGNELNCYLEVVFLLIFLGISTPFLGFLSAIHELFLKPLLSYTHQNTFFFDYFLELQRNVSHIPNILYVYQYLLALYFAYKYVRISESNKGSLYA